MTTCNHLISLLKKKVEVILIKPDYFNETLIINQIQTAINDTIKLNQHIE